MIADDDATFRRMVRYFYLEKGDPTRYVFWEAERCKRLMPAFYEAWEKSKIYERLAKAAINVEATCD
jgi:hypothetical protein